MELIKAAPLGAILTFVVALVIGRQGSTGGYLSIHLLSLYEYDIWWSWPLFLAGTGLSWTIMLLQR